MLNAGMSLPGSYAAFENWERTRGRSRPDPVSFVQSDTLRIWMIVPAATRHRKVTKADQPTFIVEVAKMTQRMLRTRVAFHMA
jgi:hypothetical protein